MDYNIILNFLVKNPNAKEKPKAPSPLAMMIIDYSIHAVLSANSSNSEKTSVASISQSELNNIFKMAHKKPDALAEVLKELYYFVIDKEDSSKAYAFKDIQYDGNFLTITFGDEFMKYLNELPDALKRPFM